MGARGSWLAGEVKAERVNYYKPGIQNLLCGTDLRMRSRGWLSPGERSGECRLRGTADGLGYVAAGQHDAVTP